jgi:hypothetical protein
MEGGWILNDEMVHDLHCSEYIACDKTNESTSEVYVDFGEKM